MQHVVVEHHGPGEMHLFRLQAEVVLQIVTDFGEQGVAIEVLVRVDHPDTDAHLVAVVREVGFYQLLMQVCGNELGQQHELDVLQWATVEFGGHFIGGGQRQHFAGFRQAFEVLLDLDQLGQPRGGKPVGIFQRLRLGAVLLCERIADVATGGKGVVDRGIVCKGISVLCRIATGKRITASERIAAVGEGIGGGILQRFAVPTLVGLLASKGAFFYFGGINDDVHGGGAAKFAVDLHHPLVDFRFFLEVIDKPVFYRQLADAPQGAHRDQHGDHQQNRTMTFGEVGEGEGELTADVLALAGFARCQGSQQCGESQEAYGQRHPQPQGHHPAEVDDRTNAADHQ